MNVRALSVVLMGLCLASVVKADPITVPNYSFESGNPGFASIPDHWVSTAFFVRYGPGGNSQLFGPAADGTRYLNLQVIGISGYTTETFTTDASVSTFAANTKYTLTVAEGVDNAFTYGLNGTAAISLLSSASASTPVAIQSTLLASLAGNTPAPDTNWHDVTLTFDTATNPSIVGQPIYIQISDTANDLTNSSTWGSVYFDNVRLSAVTVPEPASLSVLTGVASLCLLGRRRSK